MPIIFLTAGAADQQRRFRGYEAGAVDFLHKPIEPDVLRSKAKVFFDLHKQKQEVAAQRDELREATEEIARLLKESHQYAKALKEADSRKDEFLATLAHELRNPLAPIRNGLQILKMNPDETTVIKLRDMMDRQLAHMVRLIDDLLDMSRVSQGKIELRKEIVSVQSIVQSAIETSKPLIEEKQHKLVKEIPKEKIFIDADLTRMAQAVGNLLNNAAKYTERNGTITLSVKEEGDDVIIKVSDNGVGLEERMLTKIFELFAQVEGSLEQSQGGLGIGLALVKHLVEMHEGKIWAESSGLGKGSSFYIKVAQAAAEEKPVNNKQQVDKPASSLDVLIVDDNIASAKTTGWMLEMIGHKSTLAHDGEQALEIAKKDKPDVVLLDIGLPGLNGYEVCAELRKDKAFSNILLIAQTGWGQARDKERTKEAGFDYHLIKPINFNELENLLSNIEPKNKTPLKKKAAT